MFDPIQPHDDLPPACAKALIAGTVALMTIWADPCVQGRLGVERQRELLARKVVSNLFLLQRHPALGPELRQVMAYAHKRWQQLAGQGGASLAAASTAPTLDQTISLHAIAARKLH